MTDAIRYAIEGVTTQLRDYRVEPNAWELFLDAWTRQVPALRANHGFEVRAWAVPSEARLVWFLSYPGTIDEFEAADGAYYASSERLAFDPDPRQFLIAAEHHFASGLPVLDEEHKA